MIPDKTDPRWIDLVSHQDEIPLVAFASKMLLTRVRSLVKNDPSSQKVQEAVSIAYDFFKKNEHSVKEDIKFIFG